MLDILYGIVVKPIELLVEFIFSVMYKVFGSPGIAIIFVSLVVQLLVLPMYKKSDAMQEQERDKQKKMEHWVKHIKSTFKGDERYMMLQTYYRSERYKPWYAVKGSLSLLLQIPFFIAAYNYLSNLEVLKGASFKFIADLGAPDQILAIGEVTLNLLPILMTIFNIISGIIYTKGFPIKDKIQTYGLALIFLVLLYNSPSGLVLYWTLNNLFSLVKNVFMKLVKHTDAVLGLVSGVFGVAVAIYYFNKFGLDSNTKTLFIFFIVLLSLLPACVAIIRKLKADNNRTTDGCIHRALEQIDIKNTKTMFTFCSIILAIFMGAIIPLSVIGASPIEFVSEHYGPIELMLNTLAVYVGVFVLWMRIFYALASEKGKKIFAIILAIITVNSVADFYLYGRNLGKLSTYLVFDDYPVFSTKLKIIGIGVLLVLSAFIVVMVLKWGKALKQLFQVATFAVAILAVVSTVTTYNTYNASNKREYSEASDEKILPLSKNGKNVIVFMVDRAISGFIPFHMEEKPELKEMYDGFTFYPNTLSYGIATNYSTPSLFGGYEYTPEKINERKNETLLSKHNEALTVMPKMFSDNNYTVTVTDPPWAGLQWVPDISIYDEYPGIKAYNTEGLYAGELTKLYSHYYEGIQKHNFVYYSMMKVCPVFIQERIYNNGEYLATPKSISVDQGFLNVYSVLANLKNMTQIKDDDSNNFLMMQNQTPHNSVELQKPEYIPGNPNIGEEGIKSGTTINGITIRIDTKEQVALYDTNMAAMLRIGEWLNYLKEQGVYDNTRIIICSDHGWGIRQFDGMVIDENPERESQSFNPLLLVKDFNAKGFNTSNEFMTLADIPTLATEGVISNPTNPFTGNAINSSEKNNPQHVTGGIHWMPDESNGYTFNCEGGAWWEVKDNIFDKNNWKKLREGKVNE
ncbi:MAG: membrane protein insertase YidC [Lachnospiraceae bacterium]|nr:membrane protein insertase YidC [Lachnospiraceae bacterium]